MAVPAKLSTGLPHLMPSVLVAALPPEPTATHRLPSYETPVMSPAKLVVCPVHVRPLSTLVDRPLLAPTATHVPLPNATPARFVSMSLGRSVQVRPSGLVASLPFAPTATHTLSAYATAAMFELPKPLVRAVQETPSGLVANVPPAPTVTQRPPPNATPAISGAARGLTDGRIVGVACGVPDGRIVGVGVGLGFALGSGVCDDRSRPHERCRPWRRGPVAGVASMMGLGVAVTPATPTCRITPVCSTSANTITSTARVPPKPAASWR
jgi:hypothetical protein